MRKVLTWIALILIYSDYVLAVFNMPMCNLEFSGGYRHDNLEWNFAGRKDAPDELWLMKFNDMQLWQVGGVYSYTTCNNYYIRFSGDYAQIVSGNSRTRGFADDGEGHEFSSIKGKSNQGRTYDAEGCIGYSFISNGRRFVGTPVIGWAWQYQFLRMHHAEQVLNKPRRLLGGDDDDDISGIPKHGRLGEIHGLKVKYDPRWFGPFIGLDWIVMVEPCFLVFGKAEWHFSEQYRANGRWDLSNRELLTFSHHSSGHGLYLTLGGNYRLGNGWFIGVEGEYRNFQAGKGRHNSKKHESTTSNDVIFGRMPFVKKSDFNRAKWNSYSIEVIIDFRYWCDA
jgi:Protochlamydia outer membrane protein